MRRLVYKLGTCHAKSLLVVSHLYGAVLHCHSDLEGIVGFLVANLRLVFIASFLRYLHCGRYPWLWNDEHVLVLPAVVGIGLLFCVLAMG